jgi:hypothetical protein
MPPFMDDCTHAGVAQGATCPLCGRLVSFTEEGDGDEPKEQ